ncbi:MAG: hypothetical protein M8357_04715 [Desulfobulbaceae bacterium]|nr:hypothetical protein [Desulfobulbaceae bacterium]
MKLLATDSSSLEGCIDKDITAETSIVCRYRNAVRFDNFSERDHALKKYLRKTSIREGARIVPFLQYRGVEIHLLDETSRMATGTLKSIDGCLTAAFCLDEGIKKSVFESGGNTGSALTRYGRQAGLETFFFCPQANIDLLDSRIFSSGQAHLVGVEDRGRVKELAELFAAKTGIRHVPEKPWRNCAAMFRGLFILEQLLSTGTYDWLSQSVSAGFGPIGIYSVLQQYLPELGSVPRFLGIQQETNCPVFSMWKPQAAPRFTAAQATADKLLTRVMYDETPQTYRTYEDLRQLLLITRGDLLTLNAEEFDAFLRPSDEYGRILDQLDTLGIPVTLRAEDIVEKTGMIALAGTLKAIATGTIKAGSRVLCCLTSGVSNADGSARPEITVRNRQDVLQYIGRITGEK